MSDGMDCTCAAYSESECCCGADWTPQEVIDLRRQLAERDKQIKMLRDSLEITHDLYVNASSGYGFSRPDNPHNFHPDIDCCTKDEIEAHSKACSDYDAGKPISDDSWGIGTYCDEYIPAIEALSATQDLSGLVLCEAEPVAWMQDNGCYFSVAEDEFHEIPLFKARKP